MSALLLFGLTLAGVGAGSFVAGRYTGGMKPSDYWLLGTFAAGLIFGSLFAKE